MFKREHRCEWREQAASLARELQQLRHNAAFEDPGTGVGNLPQLNRDFTKLLGRYRRYEEPFAVSLIELDHYLRLGPHLEEVAVTQLARILVESARVEDSVTRVGSRQFAVLLSRTDTAGAEAFVERARRYLSSEPCLTAEGTHFFQAMGGVAEWDDNVGTLRALLDEAQLSLERYWQQVDRDAAHYRAGSG